MIDFDSVATRTTAAAPDPARNATSSPRLHQAAVQFESMMLKDLLKPLADSAGMAGTEGGEHTGALQGFAVDAIAGAMAKSGALGFARQIEQTLSRGAAKHFCRNR